MDQIISKEIEKIQSDIKKLPNLSEDHLFGIVGMKYFFNEGKFYQADFKDTYTDGANDGGIDLIIATESDVDKSLVLIQSKNVTSRPGKDEIKDIFTKMSQTVQNFAQNKIAQYSEKLQRVYKIHYDSASDDPKFNIQLALFLGCTVDDEWRNRIESHLSNVKALEDFDIAIYDLNDVLEKINSINDGRRFVSQGKIKIYKDDGKIHRNENGVLVNIHALSLRELYIKHKDDGLFEQNFRYFVKNEKIDDQINESLERKRDQFWFLNNGIIIGCKDFSLDGDEVKLEDFSIINGCQTTTLIGQYKKKNEDYDFPIQCKIVKPDIEDDDDYFNQFISEIAEASNSQKPISDRDLKSNNAEQRKLQRTLKELQEPIHLEIKRGEKSPKKGLKDWQKIKNDVYGQLILSFILQQPGTARSNKKKLFSDKQIYNKVFRRKVDNDTIKDILKLSSYYDSYLKSEMDDRDDIEVDVAKNGKLCVLAVIGFLIKHERKLLSKYRSEDWKTELTSDNINGNFLVESRDDFDSTLYSVFNELVRKIKQQYNAPEEKGSSVSNFLKTDSKYYSSVLDGIMSIINDKHDYVRFKGKFGHIFQ
jgi:hypothetical protein